MYIACSILFIVAQVYLDLKMPDYMSQITMLVQTSSESINGVLSTGGKMLLCALGSVICSVIVGFLAARVAASFSMTLRDKLFHKTLSFSIEEMKLFSTPSLITRTTNDITQVRMLIIVSLQVLIKAPIMAVWAILKILGKSWPWTIATSVAVVFLLTMLSIILIFAVPKFKIVQKLTDQINLVARENLTGLRVIRAFNAEKYQEEKFDKANNDLTKTQLFTSRIMGLMQPSMSFIMSALPLSIYIIGANLINQALGQQQLVLFSEMVVFTSYAVQIVMSFMMLSMIFIILPRASVSAKRISDVLDTELSIVDKSPAAPAKTGLVGEIEVNNISFKYPDAEEYILHDVSFKAKRGDIVAFIGSTGSGKSTIINLIPRLYDVTDGEILIDGINVKDYSQYDLHNKIGFVPQKALLFSGTIASNVAFGDSGKEETIDDVKQAIKIAQGTDFVENLDNQYEAHVARSGSNLSGGQKQRLAIARAVCKDPEILIFDDSFSALDFKTDKALREALKKETSGITSLIVAQRIGTIRDADQIIVLDSGNVVGKGTHDELMKNCEVYQEIAYSQLSKEELANA